MACTPGNRPATGQIRDAWRHGSNVQQVARGLKPDRRPVWRSQAVGHGCGDRRTDLHGNWSTVRTPVIRRGRESTIGSVTVRSIMNNLLALKYLPPSELHPHAGDQGYAASPWCAEEIARWPSLPPAPINGPAACNRPRTAIDWRPCQVETAQYHRQNEWLAGRLWSYATSAC